MRIIVVPHTHWDREWYLPFERFRVRLVRVVDELLDLLERKPEFTCFTLDGQTIAAADYLEMRPERERQFRRLVRQGRLAIGPWYVLPDEFLSGAEGLIRNLLIGHEQAQRLGGVLPVGYVADPFGHIAQLPQLLRGFGLSSFIFTRGLGDEGERLGAAFRWEAPDGSWVLSVPQLGCPGLSLGYSDAWFLGRDTIDGQEEKTQRLLDAVLPYLERSGQDVVVAWAGNDHHPAPPDLPEHLAELRRRHPDWKFELGTAADVIAAVRGDPLDLQAFCGRLDRGRYAPSLRGVNSTRLYLKRDDWEAENRLAEAEMLASLATFRCKPYPIAQLRYAWRLTVQGHPHDSVCGCSIDVVHRQVEGRYLSATQVAEGLLEQGWPDAAPPLTHEQAARAFALANRELLPRAGLVRTWTPDPVAGAPAVAARMLDGTSVPCQRDGGDLLLRPTVGPLRTDAVLLEPAERFKEVECPVRVGDRWLEHDLTRVEVLEDGRVQLTDRRGRAQTVAWLSDEGEAGDEYTISSIGEVRRLKLVGVEVGLRGPVAGTLRLRYRLDVPDGLEPGTRRLRADTQPLDVGLEISLVCGLPEVNVRATITNRSGNHRLRARVSTNLKAGYVRVGEHFLDATVPVDPPPMLAGWREAPSRAGHQQRFVAVEEDGAAVTLVAPALPEYEALGQPEGVDLSLTLLRCVGQLSRDDIPERPGHAGPGLETPEAQCKGEHTAEWTVILGGDPSEAALRAFTPLSVGWPGQGGEQWPLPKLASLVDGVLWVSTLKRAEREAPRNRARAGGDVGPPALALRVYNPTGRPALLALADVPGRQWQRVRLDERGRARLARGQMRVEPFRIETLLLR